MHKMDVSDLIREFFLIDLNVKWLVANEFHV